MGTNGLMAAGGGSQQGPPCMVWGSGGQQGQADTLRRAMAPGSPNSASPLPQLSLANLAPSPPRVLVDCWGSAWDLRRSQTLAAPAGPAQGAPSAHGSCMVAARHGGMAGWGDKAPPAQAEQADGGSHDPSCRSCAVWCPCRPARPPRSQAGRQQSGAQAGVRGTPGHGQRATGCRGRGAELAGGPQTLPAVPMGFLGLL